MVPANFPANYRFGLTIANPSTTATVLFDGIMATAGIQLICPVTASAATTYVTMQTYYS